eukprot:TRINITY_DN36464_c0_g1_i1.p1 TRINITY_DN36464_c0_g1~~TRINITY_DN36464_c0_g1_i1.p1  ORF type:complete len:584 (+),score=114.28 TRINITY_DN36464_c0_g1_i1:845-2596(+)
MCASCEGRKVVTSRGFVGGFLNVVEGIWAWRTEEESDGGEEDNEEHIDEETGLVRSHSYTVLAAVEAAADGGTSWFRKERWVRLRNPWGHGRWKAPATSGWFDRPFGIPLQCGSEEAKADETEQEGPDGPIVEVDEGTFWMRYADFCKQFSSVGISKYKPGYVSSTSELQMHTLESVGPALLLATLRLPSDNGRQGSASTPVDCIISVIQECEEAHIRGRHVPLSAARIELLELPASRGRTRHIATSSFGIQREVHVEVKLTEGTSYLAVVHWLQSSPHHIGQNSGTKCNAVLRVYAPRAANFFQGDGLAVQRLRREAYEAAARGQGGTCLFEECGACIRCWSDPEGGVTVLLFDAGSSPGGLLACVTWTLENALLQQDFANASVGTAAEKRKQEQQIIDLRPGQQQLALVSWLDPRKPFEAGYSWQAAATPCLTCGVPVGAAIPGRFQGAYRKLGDADIGGPGSVHEECFEAFQLRMAPRCLQCGQAVVRVEGRFEGNYFEYEAQKLGDHAAGRVHAECHEAFQRRFAQPCLHCGQPVMQLRPRFSGKYFQYEAEQLGGGRAGIVHEECHHEFTTYLTTGRR